MAEDEDIKAAALLFIGHCLSNAGQLREAIDAYTESAQAAITEIARAEAIASAASTQSKAGRGDEALETLKAALRTTTEEEALFELWQGLADIYDQLEQQELRGIALQKAVELRSNSPKVRSRTAWAFSEADSFLAPLVVHHYEALQRISSDDAVALNNYGVQMERLEMPIRAVALYESAGKLDNSLALANLAYLQMGGGFSSDAQKTLEKAARISNPHENVAAATAALAEKREQEKTKSREVLVAGQKLAEFTREYASAMIEESFPIMHTDGWYWKDGDEVALDPPIKKTLRFTWKTGSTERELSAEKIGRCARGVFRQKAKADHWMKDTGQAFLIADPSGEAIQIAQVRGNNVAIKILERQATPPS